MLAAFFRSNQPAVLLAVPVVVLALFMPALGAPAPVREGLMPLAQWVETLLGTAAWPRHVLGMALVIALALQLAALVNNTELMDRRNHLVALLFPVLLAGIGRDLYNEALLGMPLALFAMRRTWRMSNAGPALSTLFDAGLLIGLAALCYLPYAFLLVVAWASASVIRPFAWREYMLPLLGLALVFFLCYTLLHITDRTPWRPMRTVFGTVVARPAADPGMVRIAFHTFTGLHLLVSFSAFASSYARSVMRVKNLRSSFLAFATALVVIVLALYIVSGRFPAVLVAAPLAVLCAYALLAPRKNWLAETVAIGLLALALWERWG